MSIPASFGVFVCGELPRHAAPPLWPLPIPSNQAKFRLTPPSFFSDFREEATFELSLFAESFHDMLQRDFGTTILHVLEQERCVVL